MLQAVPPFWGWQLDFSVSIETATVASREDVKTRPVAPTLQGQVGSPGRLGKGCGCQVPPASWVT